MSVAESHFEILNTFNEIMEWGLTPTKKNSMAKEVPGSFVQAKHVGYIGLIFKKYIPLFIFI